MKLNFDGIFLKITWYVGLLLEFGGDLHAFVAMSESKQIAQPNTNTKGAASNRKIGLPISSL